MSLPTSPSQGPAAPGLAERRAAQVLNSRRIRSLEFLLKASGADPWQRVQVLRKGGLNLESALDQVLTLEPGKGEKVAILYELAPLLIRHPASITRLLDRHGIHPLNYLFGVRDPHHSRIWMERMGLAFAFGDLVDRKLDNCLSFRRKRGLRTLPKGLQVAVDLLTEGCHDLTSLGQGVSAWRVRIWHCSRLERLPEDLRCSFLEVWSCKSFKGLSGHPSIALEVRLLDCPALDPPVGDGLQLPRLMINNCGGKSLLPPGTAIHSDLTIRDCPELERLPEALFVGGSLKVSGCPRLLELPADFNIGADLSLGHCPSLEALPPGLSVQGDLAITRCHAFATLPEDLKVGGKLELTALRSLDRIPEALKAHPGLEIQNCGQGPTPPEPPVD